MNEILIIWVWNCISFFFSSSEVELKWLRWIVQFLNPIPIGDISEGSVWDGCMSVQWKKMEKLLKYTNKMVLNNNSTVMLHGNRDDSSRLVPFPQGQMKTLHHLLAASSVSSWTLDLPDKVNKQSICKWLEFCNYKVGQSPDMFTVPLNWRAERHVLSVEVNLWITTAYSVFSVVRACGTRSELAQMIGWSA